MPSSSFIIIITKIKAIKIISLINTYEKGFIHQQFVGNENVECNIGEDRNKMTLKKYLF